jgi:hypothetical protein
VARQSNTSSLPASSPSLQAARLAAPFQGVNQTPVPVVIARSGGTVTAADTTAIGRLAAGLATVTDVPDGQLRPHDQLRPGALGCSDGGPPPALGRYLTELDSVIGQGGGDGRSSRPGTRWAA